MKLRIAILTFASAFCGLASTVQVCSVNGTPVTCNLDGATSGTAPDSTAAYQLGLTDIGSDFSDVYVTPINTELQNTTGTFSAYVPGAATNGSYASLAPYMYFTVNPYGDNPAAGDPYALIIVSDSGYTATNDAWYTDGINDDSTVHIVLGGGWTAAEAGITNPDWTTCCGDLPTLGDLLSIVIPATGSEAATTWGDLNVYKARVAAGDWGGSGGPYTAFVGNVDIVSSPEPGTSCFWPVPLPLSP